MESNIIINSRAKCEGSRTDEIIVCVKYGTVVVLGDQSEYSVFFRKTETLWAEKTTITFWVKQIDSPRAHLCRIPKYVFYLHHTLSNKDEQAKTASFFSINHTWKHHLLHDHQQNQQKINMGEMKRCSSMPTVLFNY